MATSDLPQGDDETVDDDDIDEEVPRIDDETDEPAEGDDDDRTDDPTDDSEGDEPIDDSARTGNIEYELHEWATESRVMLQSLLNAAGVPHVWEGTDLLVPAVVEDRIDEMVAQVEATLTPSLDPDAPKVAYEIDSWNDAEQTELLHALEELGVPYELDVDGSLVVLEDDDARVEAAIDKVELTMEAESSGAADDDDDGDGDGDGDGDDDEEEDGDDDDDDDGDEGEDEDDEEELLDLDAQDVMTDLFVAADRLKRKATDHEGVLTLVRRADDAARMRLPYGFSRELWTQIVDEAAGLRDLIEDDESEDEAIEAQAVVLRDIIRPLV